MTHSLPSRPNPLATFTAFFKQATFTRSGEVSVVFTLPTESKDAVLDLSSGDGMALNVTVWETELPEIDPELARALGEMGLGSLESGGQEGGG